MSELATDRKTAGEEDVTAPAPESAAVNGSSSEDRQTPPPHESEIATAPPESESVSAESTDPLETPSPSEVAESNGHSDLAPELDMPAPPVVTFEPVPAEAAASSSTEADASPPSEAAATGADAPAPPEAAPIDPAAAGAAATRLKQVTERLVTAFMDKKPIEGKVIGWNKGGFHISLEGVAGFCPRSLMELGNPRKPAAYLDKTFRFLITNVDEESRRIVVSRKEILEEERRSRREEVRKKLQVGAVLRGRVESLVDFGAFVDLDGGVKGLVHLSEISRKRVEHPKEVLRNGQEVDVKVIKIEKGGDRISLSIRALEPDPWETIEQTYQPGSSFSGKVMRHSEFGLFVEVAEGIEGLVHSSQLPLGADMAHASVAVGQTITGWVREVDTSRHRLSLTMRELPTGDPWRTLHERFQEGQAIQGKVEHASKFGFFVEIEPGITGLLPFSELSTPPGRRKENMYHPGQSITVQILQLDAKRRRISLGTEGSKVEGSTADFRAYIKKQQRDSGGLNALAAAFEKLKQN